jgi:hypothetical protein
MLRYLSFEPMEEDNRVERLRLSSAELATLWFRPLTQSSVEPRGGLAPPYSAYEADVLLHVLPRQVEPHPGCAPGYVILQG